MRVSLIALGFLFTSTTALANDPIRAAMMKGPWPGQIRSAGLPKLPSQATPVASPIVPLTAVSLTIKPVFRLQRKDSAATPTLQPVAHSAGDAASAGTRPIAKGRTSPCSAALKRFCGTAAGTGSAQCRSTTARHTEADEDGFFGRVVTRLKQAMGVSVQATRKALSHLRGSGASTPRMANQRRPFTPVPLEVLLASPRLQRPLDANTTAQLRWLYHDHPRLK